MLELTAATAGPTDTPITDVDWPSADNSKLAVVLRKAQWLLDDAAYYLPQGRCSRQEREALAATLDQLAALIRDQRPQQIDQADT